MEKLFILHMLTPTRNVSPFDVNMAYDAGYDAVMPYGDVGLEQVGALVQDAIFSRGPNGVKRTGLYIGGRDMGLAADMLVAARKAMVPPFEVSVFADPSGAFTTAAAMVASVERQLARTHRTSLAQRDVLLLGGTGPVGAASAVLAASAGARVKLASHSSLAHARSVCDELNARYGAELEAVAAISVEQKLALVAGAHVILATAKAGVQVLTKEHLAAAEQLLVAADVNAVPPSGIEGIGVMDDGVSLATPSGGAVGIGALAIGNVKYRTQRGLFEAMLQAERPVYLDFRDAFAAARAQVA